jgi:hypothetical protein
MKPTHSIKRKGAGKKILREKPKQDDNAAKEENQPTTRHQKNPKKQTQTHTHTNYEDIDKNQSKSSILGHKQKKANKKEEEEEEEIPT